MPKLIYHTEVELSLDNLTSLMERELCFFSAKRAMTISMFMHSQEEKGHNFSDYQDDLWLQLTVKIEGEKLR